jgi:lipoprotein-releasing system ATP-binding protein
MLQARALVKEYPASGRILDGVDLTLEPGDAAAIMGPSGSGKSTLLHILGALDRPTSGTVSLNGSDIAALAEREQAAFRNAHIGFVFQDHALLPQCTVLENVLVPTLVANKTDRTPRARALLEAVGLAHRMDHKPAQLSGGERQRTAIARALILDPALLLCDEPTGNLDRATAATVAALLLELHRERESILVAVTHSAEFAAHFLARYELVNGRLQRT